VDYRFASFSLPKIERLRIPAISKQQNVMVSLSPKQHMIFIKVLLFSLIFSFVYNIKERLYQNYNEIEETL
jgi:hypothetical protein